jgi:hypothetical protein
MKPLNSMQLFNLKWWLSEWFAGEGGWLKLAHKKEN